MPSKINQEYDSFLDVKFDYQLLDSGDFKKLEQFGPHRFIRPAPQALWPQSLGKNEWHNIAAEYQYSKDKEYGGTWDWKYDLPEEGWLMCFDDLHFIAKPTGFGHMGLFPEQIINWLWLKRYLLGRPELHVLNLFGYTGLSTLVSTQCGAKLTHVDASRASVSWARKNQSASHLDDNPVRWYVDDALKFLKREKKRGVRYDGVILDPPTFGRGTKGEIWKVEKDLPILLERINDVMSAAPEFILFTTHSPGFSALTLKNMILTYFPFARSGLIESGEMFLPEARYQRHLPSGFYCRWMHATSD